MSYKTIMLTADLYIRVSTDEQAEKGFSQRYQEEALRKYCEANDIEIHAIIFEDHSAKDFNRPQWKALIKSYQNKRAAHPDLLLFTKWDRFSRNTGDAYLTIKQLKNLGIEARPIEQYLDVTIPENMIPLAVYMALPEAENARRSLNIRQGMQRAKREGNYMGNAPMGYKNYITESRTKYIAPIEPMASIMCTAFEKLATGAYNVKEVYIGAIEQGLERKTTSFYNAIQNPVYCGKILVNATGKEEAYYIEGNNIPIISEELFNKVQKIINRNTHQEEQVVPKIANDIFPLRGILTCPICSKVLTASTSKGRHQRYSYYHCKDKCTARFRSTLVDDLLHKELKKFIIDPHWIPLLKSMLEKKVKITLQKYSLGHNRILKDLERIHLKTTNARRMLVDGELEGRGYKEIKEDNESRANILGERLHNLQVYINNINHDIITHVSLYSMLDEVYRNGSTDIKKELLSYIFPLPLTFDGLGFLNKGVSSAIAALYIQPEATSLTTINILNQDTLIPSHKQDKVKPGKEIELIIARAKQIGIDFTPEQTTSVNSFLKFLTETISQHILDKRSPAISNKWLISTIELH